MFSEWPDPQYVDYRTFAIFTEKASLWILLRNKMKKIVRNTNLPRLCSVGLVDSG